MTAVKKDYKRRSIATYFKKTSKKKRNHYFAIFFPYEMSPFSPTLHFKRNVKGNL